MQQWHGLLHSNKTDKNKPKHHYWVQKSGLGAFVSFWPETAHRFINGMNRCIKYNPGKGFCTVTEQTKTNQNITIGIKKVDWVHSFHFWPETVHRFVNGPNRCIKCNPDMVFFKVTKLIKTSLL